MTSPAFEALMSSYRLKAKCEPDAKARAVLVLLATYAGRESRGGEAEAMLFLGGVLRKAALDLPRYTARAAALHRCMP
jgi:hypothetical protein